MWNDEQIKDHIETAAITYQVFLDSLEYIKKRKYQVTEFEVSEYILEQFKRRDLATDKERPIVAFGKNTSFVHYFPDQRSSDQLEPNDLIMIDLWARKNKKNAPFADITWMAFYGSNVPAEIDKIFSCVATARDKAVAYLDEESTKGTIPTGKQVDAVVRDYFKENNLLDYFLHSTGHSIGHKLSPHGRFGHLKRSNKNELAENLGYTIEPGLYLEGNFGTRSEINFIIQGKKLVITTPIQKEIALI